MAIDGHPMAKKEETPLPRTNDEIFVWKPRINTLIKSCDQKLNPLEKFGHTSEILRPSVAFGNLPSIIPSKLDYNVVAFASASKSTTRPLNIIQNITPRLRSGTHSTSPYNQRIMWYYPPKARHKLPLLQFRTLAFSQNFSKSSWKFYSFPKIIASFHKYNSSESFTDISLILLLFFVLFLFFVFFFFNFSKVYIQ